MFYKIGLTLTLLTLLAAPVYAQFTLRDRFKRVQHRFAVMAIIAR